MLPVRLVLLISLFSFGNFVRAADYFWVGNAGNWSDLSHWASTSGGAGGAFGSLPTTGDNVFIDANSFSIAGQTLIVDVDANADNLDFSGVTNTPEFAGSGIITISVNGSLTFTAGMTHSFLGDYDFVSTGTETISSAGQSFNQDILFSGVGGTWVLSDALSVDDEIGLQNGTIDFAGVDVTTGSINANLGTAIRTIDFGGSDVEITDAGTVLDLRGNTTNLTVTPAGSLVDFTNAGDVTVEAGDEIKTLPALTFSATTGDIRIITGGTEVSTKRISFGAITVAVDGVDFRVDENNDDSNVKTFESITLPNDCRYIIGSGDGNGGFAGTDHSIITGDFIVGDDGEGDIRGRYIEFLGDFIAGQGTDCRFIQRTQFQADFILGSTGRNDVILDQDTRLAGDLNVNGVSRIRVDEDVDISGNVNVADNVSLLIDNNGTLGDFVVLGTLNLGVESSADLGDGGVGLMTLATVTLGSEARIDFNNGASLTSIGDLNLSSYNVVQFNTVGTNEITGTVTAAGSCDIWIWLKSLTDGVQADVDCSSAQALTSNICQDINCVSTNITNNGGVDLSNNAGISFVAPVVGATFFWVGSTVGNTKTGTFSTGVNDDWSNPDNWATSSGVYSGSNACIPGAHDDVIFDANSFSSGAGTVDLDLFLQACNSFTWTGVPAGCTMDNGLVNTDREFIIFGNTSLNANLDNQFEGIVTFSAHDVGLRTITSNSSNFFGNVDFDFGGGNWSLTDDFDMNGGQRADVTFRNGTVDANAVTWTIEDDWTVGGGTFTANASTVTFDGPASQGSRQEITSNGDDFFNVEINRETNGGGANDLCRLIDPMTINNDLHILVGGLEDRGNQITGSAVGTMEIESGARIVIGINGVSTLFPTNYTTANIDLHEAGRTYYNSSITQTVSSVPDYGRLYVQNNNGALSDKVMDGPILINDLLFINDFNNLIDNGFQITGDTGEEIQMDPNSQLTLGTATSATTFPSNFTIFDIREPSTVVYNSGLAQDIAGIAGGGNARYWHVILNNALGAGGPIKTLQGDVIIRGDLTVNTGNELDVNDPSDFSIELLGDWTNNGVFTAYEGSVSFTGTAGQTMDSGGTIEAFHDFIANNTSVAGITIEDDLSIANLMTFTDGIIFKGVDDDEVVRVLTGGDVTGASNASHVDGQVEKIGGIAFDFPVGKNGTYRPISIGVPSIAGTGFIAEYFQMDPDPLFDDTSLDPTLDHISSCEYWILDRSNAVLGASTVTLSWLEPTSCGVTALPDLRVARWDGAVWRDEGNGGTTGTTSAGDVISSGAIASFSPFTLGSISNTNPLPVELLSFEAVLSGEHVDLSWITASELNSDYYVVERSTDGVFFEEVRTQAAAGNSSEELTYMDVDRNPYLGVSYYRLKQVDQDGTFSYSEMRTVYFSVSEMVIYPNPSASNRTTTILLPDHFGVGDLFIYDATGRLVYQQSGLEKEAELALRTLSAGTYQVVFSNATQQTVSSLMIR